MLDRENQEKTHTILRQMRTERGWTQIEVADAVGVTKLAVGVGNEGNVFRNASIGKSYVSYLTKVPLS